MSEHDPTPPALPAQPIIERTVSAALAEDLGDGDLTASLIPATATATAEVVCRESAVLAGAAWFEACFRALDADVSIDWFAADADALEPNDRVCTLAGSARALLSGERTALNFLQTLSGTATAARTFVAALGDSPTRILDTRKTIPGLRAAQKYAVRCGGALNHRMGLYDAILIKENHIAAAGSIAAAISTLRTRYPDASIEVEVENFDELDAALAAGADMILLDNFSPADIRLAARRVGDRAGTEISGGVEIDSLHELAGLGADFISIGALTKHVRAVDFSMRMPAADPD